MSGQGLRHLYVRMYVNLYVYLYVYMYMYLYLYVKTGPIQCHVTHKKWPTSCSNQMTSIQSPLFHNTDTARLELEIVSKPWLVRVGLSTT